MNDNTYIETPVYLSNNPFRQFSMDVELVHEDAIMPQRANNSDAGYDVFALETVDIYPNKDILIDLGWRCQFSEGFAMIMKNKSGRAVKDKLVLGACVIDSGYRGNIMLHLFNHGNHAITIRKGEKISQFIVIPVWTGAINQVENIDMDSDRGEGGFGSTGLINEETV